MSRDRAPRVFLGRLPKDCKDRDVEKFFRGFGRIREINLKNGFGFVVSSHVICMQLILCNIKLNIKRCMKSTDCFYFMTEMASTLRKTSKCFVVTVTHL